MLKDIQLAIRVTRHVILVSGIGVGSDLPSYVAASLISMTIFNFLNFSEF